MDTAPTQIRSFLISDLGASFWTSAALLLAALASLLSSGARARLRLVILFAGRRRSTPPQPAYSYDEEDDEYDVSDVSDDEEEDQEGEMEVGDEEDDDDDNDECGAAKRVGPTMGSRKFSWPDLPWGDAVVKTWEGIGVRSGLNRFGEGLISLIDLNRGVALQSFLAGSSPVAGAAASSASRDVVLVAGASTVRAWDARAGRDGTAAAAAEWLRPPPLLRRKMVGVAGAGDRTVYVGYEEGSVAVADLRSGWRSPQVGFGVGGDAGQTADASRFTF